VGELEVAALGSAALVFAVNNAHLDMRIVADSLQDGHPGYFSQSYVVRRDGPVQAIEDLKGRRVAVNTIGSGSDSAMRTMLRKHGLADKDFTTVEIDFANMPAMIDGGKIDMIITLPQFVRAMDATGKYRTLFTARDAHGPSELAHWAMRADFIAQHRATMVDFFEDHIRAVRWFLDAKNRPEALAIVARVTKQPAENLDYVFTAGDYYRSPDARPDIEAVQREIDEGVALGILKAGVAVIPTHVDLSLIEDAKRRIDGK
jgi:NitT/TauT family transport system substrate-binding protein